MREHSCLPECWAVERVTDRPYSRERIGQFYGSSAETRARAYASSLESQSSQSSKPARERITTTTITLKAVEGDFGVRKFVVEAFNEEGEKLKVGDYSQATYTVGEGATEFAAAELAMDQAMCALGSYAPRVEVVQSQQGPAPKTQEDQII